LQEGPRANLTAPVGGEEAPRVRRARFRPAARRSTGPESRGWGSLASPFGSHQLARVLRLASARALA